MYGGMSLIGLEILESTPRGWMEFVIREANGLDELWIYLINMAIFQF
jgi:hypothetical protein